MEGVGARLGRSSTRYGPTTVFTGPVRKWKKRWVHVPSPSLNNSTHGVGRYRGNVNADEGNDTVSGNHTSSHLSLYKWTPLIQSNNSNKDSTAAKEDTLEEEPPRRKSKYIPVALLEQQKIEAEEENIDEEVNPSEGNEIADDPVSTSNGSDEQRNVAPREDESQDDGQQQVVRQDLNESTLDLSLGLNSHDHDTESKPEESP